MTMAVTAFRSMTTWNKPASATTAAAIEATLRTGSVLIGLLRWGLLAKKEAAFGHPAPGQSGEAVAAGLVVEEERLGYRPAVSCVEGVADGVALGEIAGAEVEAE